MRKETLVSRPRLDFTVVLGRSTDYRRAKRIYDRARFPAFIGRQSVQRWSENGGLLFFQVEGKDAAVLLINPGYNCVMAVAILPEYRGRGLFRGIFDFAQCSWVRSIGQFVPLFENLDYVSVGTPKQGRKFLTQIMVKKSVKNLAGRLSSALTPNITDEG